MSLEPKSNQLVVLAQPEEHELVDEILTEMRGDETTLEIYQLALRAFNAYVSDIFVDQPGTYAISFNDDTYQYRFERLEDAGGGQ